MALIVGFRRDIESQQPVERQRLRHVRHHEADEVEIGAVEVGPWYPVNAIRQFQNLFPDLEFYYHPGNIVIQVGRVVSSHNVDVARVHGIGQHPGGRPVVQ